MSAGSHSLRSAMPLDVLLPLAQAKRDTVVEPGALQCLGGFRPHARLGSNQIRIYLIRLIALSQVLYALRVNMGIA
jgi:hypothetical protein